MSAEPRILFESFSADKNPGSYSFSGFREIISAYRVEEVLPALERVEDAVAGHLYAAGFVSYEAAPGLGQGLTSCDEPSHFPLVWFALYERRFPVTPSEPLGGNDAPGYRAFDWTTSLSPDEHEKAINKIRQYIAAGDTYQINFTLRHRFGFSGDPFLFYRDLCRAQRTPFSAFIDTGTFQILSVSPELFFEIRNGTITARPMKGTAKRGRWFTEDEEIKEGLRKSRKDRAENLMILDLLRNDIGKVAVTGSVKAPVLFDVETLETVHQMTSTVTAQLRPGVGLTTIFRSLFPCGSVTGAPKRRSMEIIAELEDSPRGIYTGCIGFVSPKKEAVFSVAIRTVVIDSAAGRGELGAGAGITWESTAAGEYAESNLKAQFARELRPEFQLIETLLHDGDAGYYLLERHMARLYRSAAYFGFTLRLGAVLDILNVRAKHLRGKHKVRLLLSSNGTFSVQTEPLSSAADEPMAVVTLARAQVNSGDPFLYHKTTNRRMYQEELLRNPGCTDVLFCNERNELTEGTNNNIVLNVRGRMITPPLTAGLLPGTFREELLASQVIREKSISVEDLRNADDIFLINSVRKWRKARLA